MNAAPREPPQAQPEQNCTSTFQVQRCKPQNQSDKREYCATNLIISSLKVRESNQRSQEFVEDIIAIFLSSKARLHPLAPRT